MPDHLPVLYIDALSTSPYAMSVWVTLQAKGLPFETRVLDLYAGEQHDPDFARRSYFKRVPLWCEEGFELSESSAIVEYLEERYPAPQYVPVLPQEQRQRARCRQVQAWIRSDLLALRAERSTEVVFMYAPIQPLSEAAQAAADKLVFAAEQLLPEQTDDRMRLDILIALEAVTRWVGSYAELAPLLDEIEALSLRLNDRAQLAKVLATPDVRNRLSAMGLAVGYMPQAQLASREQAYTKTWAGIIKASGFQPQ